MAAAADALAVAYLPERYPRCPACSTGHGVPPKLHLDPLRLLVDALHPRDVAFRLRQTHTPVHARARERKQADGCGPQRTWKTDGPSRPTSSTLLPTFSRPDSTCLRVYLAAGNHCAYIIRYC